MVLPLFVQNLLKQVLDTVGPSLFVIVNKCLVTGTMPECLKHAVVQPFIKKLNLDPTVLSNFRPISKLPFI